jgi:hypothetical protein
VPATLNSLIDQPMGCLLLVAADRRSPILVPAVGEA